MFEGDRSDGPSSLLPMLVGPSTAMRLGGSFAYATRCSSGPGGCPVPPRVRERHDVVDLHEHRGVPAADEVDGHSRVRVVQEAGSTLQSRVPGLKTVSTRSRPRMSLRVSHPLRSTSDQACPNPRARRPARSRSRRSSAGPGRSGSAPRRRPVCGRRPTAVASGRDGIDGASARFRVDGTAEPSRRHGPSHRRAESPRWSRSTR